MAASLFAVGELRDTRASEAFGTSTAETTSLYRRRPRHLACTGGVDWCLRTSTPTTMFYGSLDANESLGHCTQATASRCAIFDHLNRRHRCILSIDIDEEGRNRQLQATVSLIGTLARKVPSLVSLRVCDTLATEEGRDTVASALATAYSLQELHMRKATLNGLCVLLFHKFFSATERLTTLSLIDVHFHPGDSAPLLLKALKRNSSIHTLTLAVCTCFHGPNHGALLAAVLARKDSLRTLSLKRCCFTCPAGVHAIMNALINNRHLYGLSLHGFMYSRVFEEMIPRMLVGNDALRTLRVERGSYNDRCSCKGVVRYCGTDYSDESESIDPITQGIPQNKWLEELTVDLSSSTLSECLCFFKALRRNKTLRRVVIVDIPNSGTAKLYRAMRKNDVEGRVTFKCPLIVMESLEAVATCSEMSHVVINSDNLASGEMLEGALALLPRWAHIRYLGLCFSGEQFVSVQALLIPYLEANTTLRHLYLNVGGRIDDCHVRRNLLVALLKNRNLRKLHVEGRIIVDDEEAENHTLCSLDHNEVPHSRHYHAVHSVVSRNRALAMCAAHFVVGANRSDYCANALSLVSHSPQLLFNVMEMASVEEAVAAACIQRTLMENRRIQP
ncbi:hypothetical protein HPB49_015019 [Dermacentor silvarum]|uniref:Uncharacterized protein n=1 Tax=Dermacentor silvarum TaxID=543639 RepID=A0ACB8DQA6_DERSI|nr:hypothetical protein HPB49_015019 [Dermacentor silvarum]